MKNSKSQICIKILNDSNYVDFKEIFIKDESKCESVIKLICSEILKVKVVSFMIFGIKELNKYYDIWIPLNESLCSDEVYEFRVRFRVRKIFKIYF